MDEEILISQATANLLRILTPRQLLHISERMLQVHDLGFGELRLRWWNNRLDDILTGLSDKMSAYR
jgi:hypothetical protein